MGASGERGAARNALRFATYLAPCNRALYAWIAKACGAPPPATGRDWRELEAETYDVAFICSPPLVWLAGRRGGRWAVNEPASWSGYWVALTRVGSWDYFGEVVVTCAHRRSLALVARGEVDGAAIDCQVLAMELRAHPELVPRIRVVESWGPAPIQPVIARTALPPAVKERLRARLLSLEGPVMRRHLFARFAPAPDYGAIAAVVGRRPQVTAPGEGARPRPASASGVPAPGPPDVRSSRPQPT